MNKVPDYFGSLVFNDKVMKERLPEEVYTQVQKAINESKRLDLNAANVIASAMKDWAVENGATHFTHWFQPMTGVTAEKHESFIYPKGNDGIIMEFSGKELVKGESDASSFPSGGLRATFEARGYTAWDPTSYAFIKDSVLCIPTAFCSYSGQALDQKTPLLRSMEALNKQALRILNLFGVECVNIKTTVGAEQEYFLIDKNDYKKRKDLIYTGRTLFGAKPPKGQELDDHYYGAIKPRVAAFMKELDEELWKLGVLAKTEHNEVAPSQHELAPFFTTSNIASDHNQLTMEIMQKIAERHGLVCLLHEKPFEGVNGSGKHNNWSITTDSGVNLLEPGETPYENAQFLLFFCAVIKAVDDYQDLLRISVATAGNDHRLGANEAPPAVISVFVGDDIMSILNAIENESGYDAKEKVQMKVGVHVLPRFAKDSTDRNRTSPFAFTGNKFEFRMLGSASTISSANIVLNTIVAQSLKSYADRLENEDNFEEALHNLIKKTITDHKRIIFNGNGYDDEWIAEAEKRGLLNLKTTPDCLPYLKNEKNIELFESHKVFSRQEVEARCEVYTDNYCKTINIEALTAINMLKNDLLPSISSYSAHIARGIKDKEAVSNGINVSYDAEIMKKLNDICNYVYDEIKILEKHLISIDRIDNATEKSFKYRDIVIPLMNEIRSLIDEAETLTSSDYWPYPTYGKILFNT